MNCSATIAAVIVDKRCAKPPTAMPTTKLTTRKHVHSARLVGMASNETQDQLPLARASVAAG